jgi:NAD(P)-dependent dehydrogenase (short-subunit alcohol dehydrogenase family)
VAETARARGRRFDGLVNNAFSGTSADSAPDLPSLFAQAAAVNLGAVAFLTEAFSQLPDAHPRSVVNISSMYGLVSPDPSLYPEGVAINPMHYGATKAGLLQLTRTMAVQLAVRNVRVNAVVPGPFPKESVQLAHPDFVARLANRVPMKRLGRAEEIYPPVRFLLRQDASYVTGASIAVDGGWTAI